MAENPTTANPEAEPGAEIMAQSPTTTNPVEASRTGANKRKQNKVTPRIMMQAGGYYIMFRDINEEDLTKIVGDATKQGYNILMKNGTAVDAVEKAVRILEDNPNFNAGSGSFLNKDGDVECDAMIMDGSTLETGAVMAVSKFKNPVSISRKIMEESNHCAFSADGALAFAMEKDVDTCEPEDLKTEYTRSVINKYEFTEFIEKHVAATENIDRSENYDTVSAVALDKSGHFACATSTGGLPGRAKGRISDAPLVGCGGYANEFGAATTGGHGESLIKTTLAREIVFNMEKLGQDAQTATQNAVQDMERRVKGYGCAIAIDKNGNFGKAANTSVMIWATMADKILEFGIRKKEETV